MDRLVLLITVDSLRADRVDATAVGEDRGLTPNLDRLAADGTNCVDAFATGPGTRQSFPGILSSTPPLAYGGYNRLGPDRPTVAERFQDAGFTTGAVHSNAQLTSEFGYDRGFDAFYDLSAGGDGNNDGGERPPVTTRLRDHVGEWIADRPQIRQRLKRLEARFNGFTRPYATAERTRRRAEQWLTERSGDTFLWVHLMDVHVPYYPPAEFRAEVGCDDIDDAEMVRLWTKMNTVPGEVSENELADIERLYDATVRYADEEIGRLIETGRHGSEETIVGFTSDHGDEFRDHDGLTHSPQLYDELVHVPLLFDLPDSSSVIRSPVSLLDTGPTLLSAVGGSTDRLWGRDVRDTTTDRTVFSEVAQAPDDPNDDISLDARITACRGTDRTYIRDDLRDREETYDRDDDPREQRPLPATDAELRERTAEFRRRVDETSPKLLGREMSDSVESRLEDLGYLQE